MAGELTLSALQQFDPAGSFKQAQGMVANDLSLDQMQSEMNRSDDLEDIRSEAVQNGYTPDSHKKLLMDNGYFEEAMDIDDIQNKQIKSEQDIALKGLELINRTAQITSSTGGTGWPVLRGALINSKLATPESLPEEYNDQAQKIATGIIGNTDKLIKVMQFRSGNQAQDVMTQGGQIIKTGEPYDPRRGQDRDSRGAFEKQVDAHSKILMDNFPKLDEKEARLLASDVYLTKKEMSDAEAWQKLYQTGMRSSFG